MKNGLCGGAEGGGRRWEKGEAISHALSVFHTAHRNGLRGTAAGGPAGDADAGRHGLAGQGAGSRGPVPPGGRTGGSREAAAMLLV